ncbi:MAG: DUF4199 domain-containing protein [Bacteroidales bacterium]|nr:DUF4199 domain-containing protein [Bacteroidales bacterium]
MEQKVNVWKATLNSGLILALIGIVYTLVMYFLDLSLNKVQGYVFILVQLVVLFYLVKSYRDNYMHGIISFGQALGAGVVICLYYSIIIAVFTFILYKFIDPDLVDRTLAMTEELMLKRGLSQAQMDTAMGVQTKIMKPGFIAGMGIFGSMFQGLIMSLLIAAFVHKEGNPLIDTVDQQPE